MRALLDDPAYAPWFINFKEQGPWYSPKCDTNFNPPKCSDHYHMQEQTPGFPRGDGDCAAPGCDCGKAPCGFYLWNHSSTAVVHNQTFQEWCVTVHGHAPRLCFATGRLSQWQACTNVHARACTSAAASNYPLPTNHEPPSRAACVLLSPSSGLLVRRFINDYMLNKVGMSDLVSGFFWDDFWPAPGRGFPDARAGQVRSQAMS